MDWSYVAGYFDGEGSASIHKRGRSEHRAQILFHNTHLESLEAIQSFIGCGVIRGKSAIRSRKRQYVLAVERKAEMARVGRAMLPHAIIKRPQLERLVAIADVMLKPVGARGALEKIGAPRVASLYAEGNTIANIASSAGVTERAVRRFMNKHRIIRRSLSEAGKGRKWSDASRAKAAESRRRLWRDPAYRDLASRSMRAV